MSGYSTLPFGFSLSNYSKILSKDPVAGQNHSRHDNQIRCVVSVVF
jgi:hypothetical protein